MKLSFRKLIKYQLLTADVDIKSWLKFFNKQCSFDFTEIISFARR